MSFDTKISGDLSAAKSEVTYKTNNSKENNLLSIFDKKNDIFKNTGNIDVRTGVVCAPKSIDENVFFNNFSNTQKEQIKDMKSNPYAMNTCIDYSNSSGAIKDAKNIKNSINSFFGLFSKPSASEE